MYAAGKECAQRLSCQQFLERIVDGGFSEVPWVKRLEA